MKLFFTSLLLLFSVTLHAQLNSVLVKDLNPGSGSSFTDSDDKIMGHLGDKLLFVIRDNNFISHLYVSEGTSASTIELQVSASQNERFVDFIKVNATTMVYVLYNQFNLTYKLYTTDGSTIALLDKHSVNNEIMNLHYFNGYLYYNTRNAIRKIDLANTSDALILQLGFFDDIVDFYLEGADQLYYALKARNSTEQDTLMIYNTDATTTDTLANIGQSIAWGLNFQKVNGKILLFNRDESGQAYFYASNGTASGTELLKVFNWQGAGISNVQLLADDKLYFDAALDPNDPEAGSVVLFVSDGTAVGTHSVDNVYSSMQPKTLIKYEDGLYFQATSGVDFYSRFFRSDVGTSQMDIMEHGRTIYGYEGLVVQNNYYYVSGFRMFTTEDIGIYSNYQEPGDPALYFYDLSYDDVSYEGKLYATESKMFFIGSQDDVGRELYLFTHQTPTRLLLSLEDNTNTQELSCYPNPSSDIVHVKYTGMDEIVGLYLRNIEGQIVKQSTGQTEIDMSSVNAAMYFLEVELKNSRQVIKVIKK